MRDVRSLIPKHKVDLDVIDDLKKLSFAEIQPIVPELLEWLQDLNWPIAIPVAEVLLPFADRISADIINVLRTNDGIWKMWVLNRLVRKTTDADLLKELQRIATSPTRDEVIEEVHLEAERILRGDF